MCAGLYGHPVYLVNYPKGESYILLSKYFKNIALYLLVLRISFIILL